MRRHTFITLLAIMAVFQACGPSQEARVSDTLSLIPWPQSVERAEGVFFLDDDLFISAQQGLGNEARYLRGRLAELTGLTPAIGQGRGAGEEGSISLRLEPDADMGEEGYRMITGPEGVLIAAARPAGVFYGIQTMLQMLPVDSAGTARGPVGIPAVEIEDQPRLGWRAYLLDDARWFHGVEAVKIAIEQMARLKMNRLHWYLTDDQGWRIEIERYPKLTEIGSRRRDTQVGGWRSEERAGEPHGGFYTQAEIREMVRYAAERHVTIVPVISMPGHASAAIASYPEMGTSGRQIEVEVTFGVKENTFNVADEKVYTFLQNILDEVMELFPSEVIHLGGDEVKFKQWLESEQVKALMEREGMSGPAEVQRYFTNRMSRFLEERGRRMMGWNEILGHDLHGFLANVGAGEIESEPAAGELAGNSVVNFWKGDIELARGAVEQGFDIVNSLHTHTYLDYDYESIPVEKAYLFDPLPEGLPEQYHHKVLGLGCQMWSEWVPNRQRLEYQTFPRLAAYAEVGWSKAEAKDLQGFLSRLETQKTRWDRDGIGYADVP